MSWKRGPSAPLLSPLTRMDEVSTASKEIENHYAYVIRGLDERFPGWRVDIKTDPQECEAFIREELDSLMCMCHECLDVGDFDGRRCDNCHVAFCQDCLIDKPHLWPDEQDIGDSDDDTLCTECWERDASPRKVRAKTKRNEKKQSRKRSSGGGSKRQ
jgi:hypothetical protein